MTEDERRVTAAAFSASWFSPNLVKGCMCAIDGIAIEITKPRCINEPASTGTGKDSMPNLSRRLLKKITVFVRVGEYVGSTLDSLSFRATKLTISKGLLEGALPFPYHIVGDDTCASSNFMMVPINNRKATPGSPAEKGSIYTNRPNMHVEQVFGQLRARRRLLGL